MAASSRRLLGKHFPTKIKSAEYKKWKYCIFLELKKCKPVAERRKTVADKDNEWALMKMKAENYIISAISNEQLELVFSESTTLDMRVNLLGKNIHFK